MSQINWPALGAMATLGYLLASVFLWLRARRAARRPGSDMARMKSLPQRNRHLNCSKQIDHVHNSVCGINPMSRFISQVRPSSAQLFRESRGYGTSLRQSARISALLIVVVVELFASVGAAPRTGQEAIASSFAPRHEAAPADSIRVAIRDESAHGFAGSVLVAEHGNIVLNEGFGAEGGVRIGRDTRFWIASAGKQFTSAGILKCQEKGLLSLDDKISKFFPAIPDDKRPVTVEQLLTHSSGLGQSYVSEGARDRDTAVKAILAEPLVDSPGARFHYSNNNYQLAVAIIEVVTGKPYREFVHNELWGPAHLRRTGFSGDPGSQRVARARNPTPERLQHATWGGEGVYSTTSDLYRWYKALNSGHILSSGSFATLMQPSVPISEGRSALGWFLGKNAHGTNYVFTRGNEDFGPNALLYIYPTSDTEIVILTHAGNANDDISWSRFMLARIEQILGL